MTSKKIKNLKDLSIPATNYSDFYDKSFCQSCQAYCCKMVLIGVANPKTFMDVDYFKFILGFPGISVIIQKDGQWKLKIEKTCRHLDTETNLCTLQNTQKKPKTCVNFNPFQCFYKKCASDDPGKDFLEMQLEELETYLEKISFDENGNILELPGF